MDQEKYFSKLFRHEKWANEAVIACVNDAISLPDRVEEIISHVLNAQEIWIDRARGREPQTEVWQIVPRASWLKKLNENFDKLQMLLDQLGSTDRTVEYTNSRGQQFSSSLSDILTHLALHSQYHRGQVVVLIKPYVDDLPATDFIFWSRRDS